MEVMPKKRKSDRSTEGVDMQRRSDLSESTLYKEDVLTLGHKSVWGSWYDKETKVWGYACCRILSKDSACPWGPFARTTSVAAKDPQPPPAAEEAGVWEGLPTEFLQRKAVEAGVDSDRQRQGMYVEHFVRFAVGAWRRLLRDGDGAGKPLDGQNIRPAGIHPGQAAAAEQFKSAQKLREAEAALEPLIQQLQKKQVPSSILTQLDKIIDFIADRGYVQASATYMTLTLGNKRWHSHETLMGGSYSATRAPSGFENYKDNQEDRLAYETDPRVERYLHGIKRLSLLTQCFFPNEDTSKNVPT